MHCMCVSETTHTHTHIHTYIHTHTYVHTHTHTHSHTHTHTHSPLLAVLTRARTHTRTHAHTHARTRARTQHLLAVLCESSIHTFLSLSLSLYHFLSLALSPATCCRCVDWHHVRCQRRRRHVTPNRDPMVCASAQTRLQGHLPCAQLCSVTHCRIPATPFTNGSTKACALSMAMHAAITTIQLSLSTRHLA